MRVYETRPISALSEVSDGGLHNTWRRTYIVEKADDVSYLHFCAPFCVSVCTFFLQIAKNEILSSEQLLEKDQYDVDILKVSGLL